MKPETIIKRLQTAPNWKRRPKSIEKLLLAGFTVERIAQLLGTDYFSVYRVVRKHRLRMSARAGRRVPKEQIKQAVELLMHSELGPNEIAKQCGIKSAYVIYVQRSKLIKKERKKGGSFQPVECKKGSTRCEKHGLITLRPCVACEAERARELSLAIKRLELKTKGT